MTAQAALAAASSTAGTGTDGTAGARRIRAAFDHARTGGRVALIPYVVAGYPDAETSFEAALAALDAGADLLEVGLPYSDPLADGTTLQRASAAALRAGASLDRSLVLVRRIHAARPDVPLLAMAYSNQLLGRDPAAGLAALAAAGASGLILADLTPDEGDAVEAGARAADLALVYLVAPTTPADRAAAIAARSGGFLYAVSLVGVTGARSGLSTGVAGLLRPLRRLSPVPVAVGFGVSRPADVRRLASLADGAIVASALVDALGPDGRDTAAMAARVRALREATLRSRPAPGGRSA